MRIRNENIWTIYSNTLWIVLEAGGQRAVVENGQWRDGDESQTPLLLDFPVIGCQNGFDLLRELLIINHIICFPLCTSQNQKRRKNPPKKLTNWGLGGFYTTGTDDRNGSWLCNLSATPFTSRPLLQDRIRSAYVCQGVEEKKLDRILSSLLIWKPSGWTQVSSTFESLLDFNGSCLPAVSPKHIPHIATEYSGPSRQQAPAHARI